jgi:hypothetical protein
MHGKNVQEIHPDEPRRLLHADDPAVSPEGYSFPLVCGLSTSDAWNVDLPKAL